MAESWDFLTNMGAELRVMRERAGLPQQALADVYGWGRDAVSKIETGKTNISLREYLTLIDFLRDVAPEGHPAVALADRLLHRPRRR